MNKIFPNFDKPMFGFFMSEVWFPAKVSVALDINNFNPIAEEATVNAEAAKRWGFSFTADSKPVAVKSVEYRKDIRRQDSAAVAPSCSLTVKAHGHNLVMGKEYPNFFYLRGKK